MRKSQLRVRGEKARNYQLLNLKIRKPEITVGRLNRLHTKTLLSNNGVTN